MEGYLAEPLRYDEESLVKVHGETLFGTPLHYKSLPTTKKKPVSPKFWHTATGHLTRLCCLGIIFPIICIILPIYARYIAYAESTVALTASDMRLVDGQMSTFWCQVKNWEFSVRFYYLARPLNSIRFDRQQAQELRLNISFDAYLMRHQPTVTHGVQKLSMVRHFEVDDDTKEYWGFYLLKGSEVTVSSCARYLGANVMLIKGMDSLKYCAYVGQESREDMSVEVPELEGHKVLEQYRMADSGYNPSPPMFAQPNARDRSRIMELLKYRNEKRKIIKLLEDKNINTADSQSETVPASIISQVEEALQKILHQEIQSLYREVKNIIFTDTSNRSNSTVANITQKATHKSHWVSKPFDENDAKLVAILAEDIEEEENAAFEMDEEDRPALQVIADGIADDRGRIDHNHLNESESLEESSFSSSEEAMLHCKGVLISQPLVPNGKCKNTTDPTQNVIAYTVEEDSYYYFIFSSANERVKNKLTVKFDLLKTVYNTSDATDVCYNSTTCHFPFEFISDQRVVLAVPTPESNYSKMWDETFIAQSVCEPRTPLYLAFFIIIPFLIMFCALQ